MIDPFVNDILGFDLPVQAVLDGAIATNLGGDSIEDRLTAHELVGRPIFRETKYRAAVQAGPWLVSPGYDRAALEHAVALARTLGKGVFWLGENSSEALFHHLRRLGAARMPDGRILYFRYYDSDVLAAIIPMANAEQAAHLFGPARVIGLVGGHSDGGIVEKPEGLPTAANTPVSFEEWQIEVLDDRQRKISRENMIRLLVEEYPDEMGHLSNSELDRKILGYEISGRELNLTSDAALTNWARLNLANGDGASRNEALMSDIKRLAPTRTNEVFVRSMPELLAGARAARMLREKEAASGE